MASDLSGDGTSAFSIAATSVGISPSGTQFMYFMPSVSGTYYIDVSDTFGTVPDSYTVSVAAVTADFTDNPTHPGLGRRRRQHVGHAHQHRAARLDRGVADRQPGLRV